MRVREILNHKGDAVATIGPDATVAEAIAQLSERGFGALVVSADGESVDGILSERDIVRRLHDDPSTTERRVDELMTAEVITCGENDTIAELMALMTDRRIRHLPVVTDEKLIGVISIGDVVKARLGELEDERQHLHDYITTGR